jgi:hypothetical protein
MVNNMQGMSLHFEPRATAPHFSPYSASPIAPHAAQYHAPAVPHMPETLLKRYQSVVTAPTPQASAPVHQQPHNSYVPEGTVTNITNHEVLHTGQKLKPGDVVEVNNNGRSELEYVNYNNQLRPLNNAALNRVPGELRDHIRKIGGPAYFAHEIHNRLPTQGLFAQFKQSDFHGPNKPLI